MIHAGLTLFHASHQDVDPADYQSGLLRGFLDSVNPGIALIVIVKTQEIGLLLPPEAQTLALGNLLGLENQTADRGKVDLGPPDLGLVIWELFHDHIKLMSLQHDGLQESESHARIRFSQSIVVKNHVHTPRISLSHQQPAPDHKATHHEANSTGIRDIFAGDVQGILHSKHQVHQEPVRDSLEPPNIFDPVLIHSACHHVLQHRTHFLNNFPRL
mmetsp:Transcript_89072/g.238515  ORF Transcript_89072/g.238515 Transcript_89072/m.238515 type:complete len:215 (+) Transcript_89072:193-837(+)